MPLHLLSSDSPACFKAVSRQFQPSEIGVIENAYSNACDQGVIQEWFQREDGVSFNPRPARLIQLTIEARHPLCAIETVLAALSIASILDQKNQGNNIDLISHDIAAAPYCLDWFRHLHLIRQSPLITEYRKSISDLHMMVCQLTERILHQCIHESPSLLSPLFQSKLQASYSKWM